MVSLAATAIPLALAFVAKPQDPALRLLADASVGNATAARESKAGCAPTAQQVAILRAVFGGVGGNGSLCSYENVTIGQLLH